MKKNITLLITLAITGFVTAQNVYIPDPNFKETLVKHHIFYAAQDQDDIPGEVIDTDGDGEISIAEAEAFDGYLFCFFRNISDLTGIEAFPNIKWLICSENNLYNLDLSNNLALEGLDCSSNNLYFLDLSNNVELKFLDCLNNNLGYLDLSNHTNLMFLECSYNLLTYLNVKNGNNQNFLQDEDTFEYLFFAEDNPNLTCIEVDNATWSTQNWTNIDQQTTFSENCDVSVNNFASATNFTLFPNPISDFLTIKSETNTIENIKIYDIKGVLLYEKQIKATEINLDLSLLKTGIYFVKIKNEFGEIMQKIIKN